MTPRSRRIRLPSLVLVLLLSLVFGGSTLNAAALDPIPAAQTTVVRYGGFLTPATGVTSSNKDIIAFDVTFDADGVPTLVDIELTISSLVVSATEGPLCATGAQSDYAGQTDNIQPWPDPRPMYTFLENLQPGGTYPSEVSVTGLLGRSLDGGYIGIENSEGAVVAFYQVSIEGSSFTMRCTWTWDINEGPGGTLSFFKSQHNVGENETAATITVVRQDKTVGPVTVDYATSNQSATAGQDYTTASGTLTFADGETQKTFTVDILPDDLVEGAETLGLTLSNPTGGAVLGTPNPATLTIDDTPDLAVLAYDLADFDLVQSGSTFTLKDILLKVINVFDENGETVPQATVEVRSGGDLIHSETVGPLAPGGTPQEITFDWDVTDLLVDGGGTADVSLTAKVDPGGTIPDRNPGNNSWPGGRTLDVLPVIEEIDPKVEWHGGFFLQNVGADNKIDVVINDWNGEAQGQGEAPLGKVRFKHNDNETIVAGQAGKTSHTYSMGSLESPNECAANILLIQAEGAHPSFLTDPGQPLIATAVSLPVWVEWVKANLETYDLVFLAQVENKQVKYLYNFAYPSPAFGPSVTVPDGVPVLGGDTIGFVPATVATIKTTSKSGGQGMVKLSGQTGFTSPLITASGELFGNGETRFRCKDGSPVLDFDSATFGFVLEHQAASGALAMEDVLPGVGDALAGVPYWGPELAANFDASTVSVAMNVGGGFQFTISEQGEGELEFESARAVAQVELTAAADIMLLDELSLSVTGGGTPYVRVKVPRPPPDFLEEVGIDLAFEAVYQMWAFSGSFNVGATCSLPGGCSLTQRQSALLAGGRTLTLDPGWQLLPAVSGGQDYAIFQPSPLTTQRSLAAGPPPGESIRVTNVYTYPDPALAVDGNGTPLVVYVHADPAGIPGRATALRSQDWDGAAWRARDVGTVDGQPDFNPMAAYRVVSGSTIPGLLIWERSFLAPGITPSLDITFTQSLEILAAPWDGSAWAAPARLTTNSLMDRSPRLAPTGDGAILALWQTGHGDTLGGTAANPVSLTYALWDGTSWSTPAAAVAGLSDVRQMSLAARSATEAALVLAKGEGPGTDTELYAATFDGTNWSALQAVTANAVSDANPVLAYDSSGRRHLFWLEQGELRWTVDSWTGSGATVPLALAQTGPIQDLSLVAGPDGQPALTWQSGVTGKPGIAYSRFHAGTNAWSAPRTVVDDAPAESSLSTALAPDGDLHLAYTKAETSLVTRTLTLTTGQTITVPNVTVTGKRDLAVLTIAPGPDLVWDSLAVTPDNPAPGQTITLTGILRNAGDLPVSAPRVRFLDGTTTLATQDLAALGGGYTQTVTVQSTLGSANGPHTLRAVADPDGQVTERDEANNERSLVTSLPDLGVMDLAVVSSGTGLTLTAVIHNDGAQATANGFQATVRAEHPVTGTLLAQQSVATLAAGGAVTVSFSVDGSGLPGGDSVRLWVEVDTQDQVTEHDERDNQASRPVDLLPDLAVAHADIAPGAEEVRITIHNWGLRTSTPVNVWLGTGDAAPMASTATVTATLSALPAGGQTVLSLSAAPGAQIFAVRVDGANVLAEMAEYNNLAFRRLVVEAGGALYLPSIMR